MFKGALDKYSVYLFVPNSIENYEINHRHENGVKEKKTEIKIKREKIVTMRSRSGVRAPGGG